MIDSIKVTEVADTITPAEETYPPNYNFSIASEWEQAQESEEMDEITDEEAFAILTGESV